MVPMRSHALSLRSQRAAFIGIFFLALFLRTLYLAELSNMVIASVLVGDARGYVEWAATLAQGDWFGDTVFDQAPLYPYFLAAIFSVAGQDIEAIRAVQIMLGATSCVLLAVAATRFFGARIGIAAGCLLAVYPPAIFFDGLIQKASLALFWMALLLFCLSALHQRKRNRWCFFTGAVLGAMILTRENAMALLPVLGLWVLIAKPRTRLSARAARLALFAVGAACVLIPVGLRNLAIGDEFLLTSSQLGRNLFAGNNPSATGIYRPPRPRRDDIRFEQNDATALAEESLGRSLSAGEVSNYWVGRTLSYIADQPGHWAGLLWSKWLMFWNATEIADSESIEAYREESRLLRYPRHLLHFGTLLPLATLGIWLTRRDWRSLSVLYLTGLALAASVALFFVFARYRLPVVPIVAMFAAAGIVLGLDARGQPPRRSLYIGLCIAAAIAIFCNRPIGVPLHPRATNYYNVGLRLLDQQRWIEAESYFRRTLAIAPTALKHESLGDALANQGKREMAARHYEAALRMNPRRGKRLQPLLARIYTAMGKPTVALRLTRLTDTQALNSQPFWSPDGRHISFVSNRSGLWQVWLMNGDGTEQRQLTRHPDPVGWPSWSADGKQIFFYAGRSGAFHLFKVGVDGGPSEPLLHEEPSDFRPLQRSDEHLLLFDRYTASADTPNHDIYIRDLANGTLRQLTDDPGDDSDARWSPSGDRIVFHSDHAESAPDHSDIYVINADGSGVTRLTSGGAKNAHAAWSPTGNRIVYTSERNGNRDLRIMNADGSGDRPLTNHPGFDGDPAWSPDGRFILFTTSRFGDSRDLALLELNR
jgi:Tol biopolymer transport system component/4-amino-4-deoxy-L-arabinose transferase-like glycosyltransferase